LIPSCSIPASDQVRAGFLFSRYGFDFRAIGKRSLELTQKQAARGNPAPGGGTYSGWEPQVKAKRRKSEPNIGDLAHFGKTGPLWNAAIPARETNRFRRRCTHGFRLG
jgi:hypothetical protein